MLVDWGRTLGHDGCTNYSQFIMFFLSSQVPNNIWSTMDLTSPFWWTVVRICTNDICRCFQDGDFSIAILKLLVWCWQYHYCIKMLNMYRFFQDFPMLIASFYSRFFVNTISQSFHPVSRCLIQTMWPKPLSFVFLGLQSYPITEIVTHIVYIYIILWHTQIHLP